jgi:hypothetical protein
VWRRRWTVHVQQIGRGDHALHYLARYVFHVALTNARLKRFAHEQVTFTYTHAQTHETRPLTLPVDTFLDRYLQHVLPRGLTKIRYFGLLSPSAKAKRERARELLVSHATTTVAPITVTPHVTGADASALRPAPVATTRHCGICRRGHLHLIERVHRPRSPPFGDPTA